MGSEFPDVHDERCPSRYQREFGLASIITSLQRLALMAKPLFKSPIATSIAETVTPGHRAVEAMGLSGKD
jgi:hypothetical protein